VVPFGLSAARGALLVMATVYAVDVSMVAVATQVKESSASIDDALNLPKIVHSRKRLGIRPPRRTRATTFSSNASTRGDPGLGG
jgi:hypothetical protein